MTLSLSLVDDGRQFPPAAIFRGGTDFSADLTVTPSLHAQFSGSTGLSATLRSLLSLAASFSGGTGFAATLRIGSEANVFLAASFSGGTSFTATPRYTAGVVTSFEGGTDFTADLTLTEREDFGFTFFVDILDAQLSTALQKNIRRYRVRLMVDGQSVPIRSARLKAPEDRLGTELSVDLARPSASQVGINSSVNFDLGVWAGSQWAWLTLLSGAQLNSRGVRLANQAGLPADAVALTFVDIVGDRWNRRPDAQTILYDSQRVDAPTVDQLQGNTISTRNGSTIAPVYLPIAGMRLWDVLHRAYVAGCGFSKVITNIDNFPVEQAVFSLTGGYDGGVRPLLSPYEPIAFPVGNDLWIVTLDNPLPAGFAARELPASSILSIDDSWPAREPVTALLVHLKDTGLGEFYTEDLIAPPPVTSGTFGTPGYTETSTEQRVRKYRTFDNPLQVIRVEVVYEKTTVEDFQFNITSRETRTDAYDSLNRFTGYTRTTELRLPDLTSEDGSLTLQRAEEESQFIIYEPHPLDPNRDVQSRIETRTSGLILVDTDNEYLGQPYKIPYRDAHKSGTIEPGSDQEMQFGPTKTILETLRVQGGQVMRERRVQNHLSNVPDSLTVQALPGDASIDRRRDASKTRQVLLTLGETEPGRERRVQDFDATGLPPDIGLRLAEKRLQRLNTPPRELSVPLAFVDPSLLRRGTDLKVRGRTGYVGTYIVRGWEANFEMDAAGAFTAQMTLHARELLS
jgi:hypothetical protein